METSAFDKLRSAEYGKKFLKDIVPIVKREEKVLFREERIIKVGDVDAAWIVYTNKPDDKALPTSMSARCEIRHAGYDVTLKGEYRDSRSGRMENDFKETQDIFIKLAQSFRFKSGNK